MDAFLIFYSLSKAGFWVFGSVVVSLRANSLKVIPGYNLVKKENTVQESKNIRV